MIAIGQLRRSATLRARLTEPMSGETDDEVFVHLVFEVTVKERAAQKVIDGDIEEALDLRGVKVHREDAVGAGGS